MSLPLNSVVKNSIRIGARLISMIVLCVGISLLLSATTLGSPKSENQLFNNWELTAPLPEGLADARTVAVNSVLYMVGGQTVNRASDQVLTAQLQAGGYITKWNSIETALPISLYLHSVLNIGNAIYVMGGYNGFERFSTVYKGTPTSTSTVFSISWTVQNDLLSKLVHQSATVLDNCVYVIGGIDAYNIVPWSTVYRTTVNAGNLSFWVTDKPLPKPRRSASAVAYKDPSDPNNRYIYLLGGFDGTNASNLIYYSKVNSDCSLGEWNLTNRALPYGLYYHASVVFNNNLFIIGGKRSEQEDTPNVFSTQIGSDGGLASWVQEDSLPVPLHRHGAVIANSDGSLYMYVIGGRHGNVYQSQVYRTRLHYWQYYLPLIQQN